MRIYKLKEVLKSLEYSIRNKTPFSLIRFGDGGIKFIHAMINDDTDQLNDIIEKEGIPRNNMMEVFELWGYYARHATFIDSPEVYFSSEFWPRLKGPEKPMNRKTRERLENWKELYNDAEFDTDRFCNPEINFLSILRRRHERNLLDILKGKRIGCITTFPEIKEKLSEHSYDIDVFQIVGQYERHYENSFIQTIDYIRRTANIYDIWLIAAGELGRIYTGLIKQLGGRAFDIGFVIEYWLELDIPIRLKPFLKICSGNSLELQLKSKAYKFNSWL
jgi:hypothetical protein